MTFAFSFSRSGIYHANFHPQLQWPRLKSLKVTFEEIRSVVDTNAKQRFSLKPVIPIDPNPIPSTADTNTDLSHYLIRANQGHSIAVSSSALLTPITIAADNVPETVVHGTYYGNYAAILESGGLSKMGRNHVHFATGILGESGSGKGVGANEGEKEEKAKVLSGMRQDAELLIYIDVQKSLEDGNTWWLSENGVVLTEGDGAGLVGTQYWKKVTGRRDEVGVLWEEGKQVAELPESFRGRKAPRGKSAGAGRGGSGASGNGRGRGRGGHGGKGRDVRNARGGKNELDAFGEEETHGVPEP